MYWVSCNADSFVDVACGLDVCDSRVRDPEDLYYGPHILLYGPAVQGGAVFKLGSYAVTRAALFSLSVECAVEGK